MTEVTNAVVKEFNGRLDIFVANAGVPWTQGRMIDGELSHYHKVTSIDFDGVFYCARAAGEIWRRQYETGVSVTGEKLQNYLSGSFVATASMSGHIANIPQLQAAVSEQEAGCRSTNSSSTMRPKQASFICASLLLLSGSSSLGSTASHQAMLQLRYQTLSLLRRRLFGEARRLWVASANLMS